MPKIKEIPLPQDIKVCADELGTVAEITQTGKSAHYFLPSSKDDHSYLLGVPYFDLNYKKDLRQFIPVGQYKTALQVFRQTRAKPAMVGALKLEYRAIARALLKLGVTLRIVDLERGHKNMGRWLRQKGCLSLELPYEQIIHWQIFPRDMCVYIKEANTVLVHSNLFRVPFRRLKGCQIIHTLWGEGGRVLLSGDHMLLGCCPEARNRVKDSKIISRLRDMGMKVGLIPHALFYGLSPRGAKSFVFHHSHIDLSGSLLRGKDGGFHLVLDSSYRTGPLAEPLSERTSIDLVRKNCEEIEVEVHVPRKRLSVPLATAMVQFEDGRVLMTSGDDEVLTTAADIVGPENMEMTNVPIVQYPIFGGAGLHCLITENPVPIVSGLG
ncbi:MAG: hypothetical protein JW932_10355 [Deltaproteobacteria bacterium]|nr:hypothetical protein [Deltaproteobacteria bacterium]